MNFPGSPSKYKKSHSRFYDLKRISKAIAVKALAHVSPKPEKVLQILSKNEQSLRGAVPDNPTIKSLIQAYKQAEDNVQKKRILSLLCLEYSKKAIQKAMGVSVSWYLHTESRFLAKYIGPGGDLPALPYRTLTFSDNELTEVLAFICAKKNISGLAWGSHEFLTSEGERLTIPNFQRHCDPETIWKQYEAHKNLKMF